MSWASVFLRDKLMGTGSERFPWDCQCQLNHSLDPIRQASCLFSLIRPGFPFTRLVIKSSSDSRTGILLLFLQILWVLLSRAITSEKREKSLMCQTDCRNRGFLYSLGLALYQRGNVLHERLNVMKWLPRDKSCLSWHCQVFFARAPFQSKEKSHYARAHHKEIKVPRHPRLYLFSFFFMDAWL